MFELFVVVVVFDTLNPKSKLSLLLTLLLPWWIAVALKLSNKSKLLLVLLSTLVKSKSSVLVSLFVDAKKSNSSSGFLLIFLLILLLLLFSSFWFELKTSKVSSFSLWFVLKTSILSAFFSTTGSLSFLAPLSTLSQKLSCFWFPYFWIFALLNGCLESNELLTPPKLPPFFKLLTFPLVDVFDTSYWSFLIENTPWVVFCSKLFADILIPLEYLRELPPPMPLETPPCPDENELQLGLLPIEDTLVLITFCLMSMASLRSLWY